MNHRIGWAIAVLLAGVSRGAMSQNPGVSSKFIPPELMARMMERPAELPSSVTVAGGRDAAWQALTEVFKSFEIPVSYSDPAAGEVGAIKAKIMRRLGKQPLSQYLRCGEGLTGPNADSYVVYFSIAGFVKAAPNNEVTVATLVTAHAIDLPNGRNDVMDCTTSGRLEEKIAKAVQLRLAVKPS